MIAPLPNPPPCRTRPALSGGKARRRVIVLLAMFVAGSLGTGPALAQPGDEAAAWQALQNGAILLLRHATAPGVGDPPGFKLDDCSTQRNLSADGQAQALAIGRAFTAQGVTVGALWSSAWCRAKETAELAFPKRLRLEPAFNSFFNEPSLEPVQTRIARDLLLSWRGPGALVVVTHDVNIQALTGVTARSGEGVVLRPAGDRLEVVGRLGPFGAGQR